MYRLVPQLLLSSENGAFEVGGILDFPVQKEIWSLKKKCGTEWYPRLTKSAARSSKSRFPDRNTHVVSRSGIPRSSGWLRWKAESALLRFKKNPDEKYFFIMEKFYFEKYFSDFFRKIWKLLKNFPKSTKKSPIDIFQKKSENFQKYFFQNKISSWWKNIFCPDFF